MTSELFQPRVGRADGPNVLLVDDVDANLVALEAALSSLRCNLVYARSGSEALGHLLRDEFALILMDIQMPGMDGYETARLVRSRRKTAHIPIIFLTAHAYDASTVMRVYDLGAVDFLPKPLDVDILRAKARAFIALHERTLEVAELRAEAALRDERARQEGEAVRRDMERLADADRRKTALLGALAHDLDTALTDANLDRARQIVDDLAAFARASKHELATECVDLALVVDRAANGLVVDAPAEAVAVEVDLPLMIRALANLFAGATRVTWRREYGHALLHVTGVREDLAVVFAKQIVEVHHGRMTVVGDTVELQLRAAEFPLVAARNRQQRAQPRILRVLVVDGDEQPIATLLSGRGHEVLVAHDAKDALGLLAEYRPDVAMIALALPQLDGYEVAKLARTIEPPLATRFVALGDADRQQLEDAGFTAHFAKPLASSAVILALET